MKTITVKEVETKFSRTLTQILEAAERDKLSGPFVINVYDDNGIPILQAGAERKKRDLRRSLSFEINSMDYPNLVNLVGKKLDVLVTGVSQGRPRMMSKRQVDSPTMRYAVTRWESTDPRYRQILVHTPAQPAVGRESMAQAD